MQSFLSSRRWLVLAGVTLIKCIVFFPNGWAVFLPYVSQQYGYSADSTALVMPLIMVFFALFSIAGGRFQDQVSPRRAGLVGIGLLTAAFFSFQLAPKGQPMFLYLGFCLLYGAGYGFLYPAANSTMLKWFADRTGFASGLSSAVAGFYLILQTYAAEALLSRLPLATVMSLFGIYSLAVCLPICSLLVPPDPAYLEETLAKGAAASLGPQKAAECRDFTPGEMLRTPQFYLFFAAIALVTPAYILISPRLVNLCMDKGLSKQMALAAISCGSVAITLGQLTVPPLSDRLGRKPVLLAMWALGTLCSGLFMLCGGVPLLFIWAGLALSINGGSNLVTAFTIDMFGFRHSGTNAGLINIAGGIGALLGPVLLTLLTPVFGGNTIYLIGIAGAALGLLCIIAIDPHTVRPGEPSSEG